VGLDVPTAIEPDPELVVTKGGGFHSKKKKRRGKMGQHESAPLLSLGGHVWGGGPNVCATFDEKKGPPSIIETEEGGGRKGGGEK